MIHLVHERHDVTNMVTSVWCDGSYCTERSSDVTEEVTCPDCLDECALAGRDAAARLEALRRQRHPDWVAWASAPIGRLLQK